MEVKWVPNEDAENPSLPLSMKQRQQLLQLENTIRSSPDPNGTLQQVAQQNGMSPQELATMLEKNARDLQQDPSLLQPTTVASVVTKVFASFGVLISQCAQKHPRSFALMTLVLIFMLYSSITIPRTGMHISRGTAVFAPNQRYLQRLADSPSLERRPLSIKTKKTKWDDLGLDQDGVEVHKLPRSAELSQAFSTRVSLFAADLLEDMDDKDEESEEGKEIATLQKEICDTLFQNAANVISERQLSEFPSDVKPLKSASSKRHGILMVPGLGSFGRYGLVRWQVTSQIETDKDVSVTLATLKGDFFHGQIHIEARKFRSKVVLTTHIVVPKRGKKLKKKIASKIVSDVSQSLESSITQRTRQNLARRSIGRRFKLASHARASERRKTRFDREKEIEEMAEDRRRKWQRSNPDAGRYRPSGRRQRSPNNC